MYNKNLSKIGLMTITLLSMHLYTSDSDIATLEELNKKLNFISGAKVKPTPEGLKSLSTELATTSKKFASNIEKIFKTPDLIVDEFDTRLTIYTKSMNFLASLLYNLENYTSKLFKNYFFC